MIRMTDWKEHFEKLLNEDRKEYIEKETWEYEDTGLELCYDEVEFAVTEGKNGKTPGPGDINLELLKYGGSSY